MEYIHIGDLDIPIVETYETSNGPSGTSAPTLPSNERKSISGTDAMYYYNKSAKMAFASAYTDTGSPPTHGSRTVIFWHGGNLDLHGGVGGASFYVEAPDNSGTSAINAVNWGGRWMTGTNTDSYISNAFQNRGYPSYPSAGNTMINESAICAIRIKYTSNPGYYNYQFVVTWKVTNITPTKETVEYFVNSSDRCLNMNFWRRNGIEAYLEETEKAPDEDPTDEGEPSDEDGGDGDHDKIYDPIPIPNMPTMGAANAGFVTMYKLGLSLINQFANDMFASTVWEAIKLFFSNPIDFLVGCLLLPFEPTSGGSYYPKFGATRFDHAYPVVINQYKDIDCGSIQINEYWGSCFDYEPYTKIQIWLPYIGYRDLPVDEIMNQTVSVKYRVDCLTGDCVAFIYTGVVGETGPQIERVIAQYYGNCGVRVPFGAVSFDSAIAASINLVGAAAPVGIAAGAGALSAGGIVGGTIAAMKEGGAAYAQNYNSINASAAATVNGMKGNVQKGGAAGASTGYMSIQKPYIIKRIPRQNLPSNFMQLKGYPSNIGGKLADFTGLAVVDDVQLNNIPAMEDERYEILEWLRGGVII